MSDTIYYDYDEARQAYEEMVRANEKINTDLQDLVGHTRSLLERIAGDFADQYEQRVALLQKEIDEVNQEFAVRAQGVNQAFEDMQETDRSLARGL